MVKYDCFSNLRSLVLKMEVQPFLQKQITKGSHQICLPNTIHINIFPCLLLQVGLETEISTFYHSSQVGGLILSALATEIYVDDYLLGLRVVDRCLYLEAPKLPGFSLCLDDQFACIYMLNEGQKHKKLQVNCIFDRRIKKKTQKTLALASYSLLIQSLIQTLYLFRWMKNTVSLKMNGRERKSCYNHAGCRKNISISFVQSTALMDNEKRFLH